MTIVNNCADPRALEQNHELAIREIERQLLSAIDDLSADAATLESDVDSLTDTLNTLFATADQDLRSDSCLLPNPKEPTRADLESMVQAQTGLNVIGGRVFLPGSLDLSAVQRIYSVVKSVDDIYGLIPELFAITTSDPVFGEPNIVPRVLVMELRYDEVEEAQNPCNPEDTVVTTTETLVSINKPLSEDSETRLVLAFWIGPPDVSSTLRKNLVKLGFTDDEIVSIFTMKSKPGLELYSIPDPARLGRFFNTLDNRFFSNDDVDALVSVLTSDTLSSVDDTASLNDIVTAIRDIVSQPATRGCGIPAPIALMSILNPSSYGPSDPESACPDDDRANAFQTLNDVFGATGVIQRTINSIFRKFQATLANAITKLYDMVSFAERYLLNVGQLRVNIGAQTYGGGIPVPGVPQVPPTPTVNVASVEQFVSALAQRVEFIQGFINATSRIVLGVSLLACSASLFGSQATRVPSEFRNQHTELGLGNVTSVMTRRRKRGTKGSIADAFQTDVIALPRCRQDQLDAHLDAHVLTFDWINQIMQQLLDLMSRLRNLIYELRLAQQSAQSTIRLQCSITETAQLAADIARRMAAQNFGSFTS